MRAAQTILAGVAVAMATSAIAGERISITARPVAASKAVTAEEVLPYREALIVREYRVERVHAGRYRLEGECLATARTLDRDR